VDERMTSRGHDVEVRRAAAAAGPSAGLPIASIFAGVGATAIAVGNGQPVIAAIAWIAVVLVNLLYLRRP
jgi:hypothetical protein